MTNPSRPLIIQSDFTLLLEVHNALYEDARDALSAFAELVKSPEHIHTYRISAISLWNAASSGTSTEDIAECLIRYSKYGVPQNVDAYIKSTLARFGQIKLLKSETENMLKLVFHSKELAKELEGHKSIAQYLTHKITATEYLIHLLHRGTIKHTLIQLGHPVEDWVGFSEGTHYSFTLRDTSATGKAFQIRHYQKEAAEVFFQNNRSQGGHGVIVLPCGSGKTLVGILAMHKVQNSTLILTSNIASCHQWIHELLDKTNIPANDIGEFTSEKKDIKPITIATYQILIYRKNKNADFPHFSIFQKHNWGLIIYDEVHLLPAPIFSITANIQSKRRLGLTATLIREDDKHNEVFSLIGPKRYDIPWKELEKQGFIAKAVCYELRIPFQKKEYLEYIQSSKQGKFKIASLNKNKIKVIEKLMDQHENDSILIIGQYIQQLKEIAQRFEIPIITGKTMHKTREHLYDDFRSHKLNALVVSKVANFAIDLPDASIAIQVSGTYGSRQEEAQRLGRILRPKNKISYFYSLVTKNSVEEVFNHKRQLFLAEQGYEYLIQEENL